MILHDDQAILAIGQRLAWGRWPGMILATHRSALTSAVAARVACPAGTMLAMRESDESTTGSEVRKRRMATRRLPHERKTLAHCRTSPSRHEPRQRPPNRHLLPPAGGSFLFRQTV